MDARKSRTTPIVFGDKVLKKNATFLLALIISGYPVAATLVTMIGSESSVVTWPYRGLVLAVSFTLFFACFFRKQRFAISFPFLLFASLYLIRLFSDYINVNDNDREYLIIYFTSVVLIPALLLSVAGIQDINEMLLAKLIIFCGLILVAGIFLGVQSDSQASDISKTRLSIDALNPIALGNAAASAIIAAAWLLTNSQTDVWRKLLLGIIIIFFMYVVILAASRGPLVSLAFAIGGLMLARLRYLLWVGPLAVIALAFYLPETLLYERFTGSTTQITSADQNVLIRFEYQIAAIEQFVQNPWFGNVATLIAYGPLTYPHNILVEILMSLGVIGIFAFVWMLARIQRVFLQRSSRTKYQLVKLMFIQYLVGAQFSGSLWGTGQIWAIFGLLSGYQVIKHVNGRERINLSINSSTAAISKRVTNF